MAKTSKKTAGTRSADSGSEPKTVKVDLQSSYGYTDPITKTQTFYGPGKGIEVPERLAKALGKSASPKETSDAAKGTAARTAKATESTSSGGATGSTDSGSASTDAKSGASDTGSASDADAGAKSGSSKSGSSKSG